MVGFYVDKQTYDDLESQDFALKSKDMLDQFKASIEPAPPPQLDTTPVQQQPSGVPTTADISNPTQYVGSPSLTLDDIYRIAKQQGHSDEGARVATAIAKTEGGLTGAAGDNNQSFGPFQFYSGGQLANYAKQLGMGVAQAGEYVRQHPGDAAQWALQAGGYLGDAIRRGAEKGLSGTELATYAQNPGKYHDWGDPGGQVSVSPERAGQNYDALYGGGAGPTGTGPSGGGAVASGVGAALGGVGRAVGAAAGQVGQAVGDVAAPVADFGASLMADFRAKINAPTAPPEQPTTQLPDTQAQFNTPAEPTVQPKDFGADLMAKFRASLDNTLSSQGEAVGGALGAAGEAIGGYGGVHGRAIGTIAGAAGQVALDVATSNPYTPFSQVVKQTTGLGQGIPTDEEAIAQVKDDSAYQAMVGHGVPAAEAAHQTLASQMYAMAMADAPLGKAGAIGKAAAEVGGAAKVAEGATVKPASGLVDAAGRPLDMPPAPAQILGSAGETPPPGASDAAASLAKVKAMYEKPPGPGLPGPSAIADRITKELFNQNIGASHVQEIVERQLGTNKLPDALNLEAHMAVNPGMITHLRVQETLQPALQQVGADGLPDLKALLTFQDNIDKAAAVGKRVEADLLAMNIDPAKAAAAGAKAAANRKFSGDMTAAKSQAAIVELQTQLGPRFAVVQDSADKAVEFGKATRDRLLSSGMIDQPTRDYFEQTFPNYVPIRILDYLDPQAGKLATGKSFSVESTGIHRLSVEGTERYTMDPISALMEQAGKVEALAARNDSFNTLVNLRNASPELKTLMPAKPKGFNPTKDDLVVTGLRNGKQETYVATDYLKEALNNESYMTIPYIGPVMGLYRSFITSKSPTFLARNSALDAFSYTLRSTIREGGPWPKNLSNVITELGRGYADAFQGIDTQTFHGNTANMLRAGGGQFGWRQRTPAQLAATAEDLTHNKAWEVNNTADALRIIKKVLQLKPIEATGERIELAPRSAAYSLATKRGATPLQAMADARSVTIDFAMGGKLAKLINQVIPFFNVTLQASAQITRAYHENPRATLATGMTFLAAPAVAAYAWNNATEVMKRDYEDVPAYAKEQGIIFLIPGMSYNDAQGNRHPQFISLRTREFTPAVAVATDAAARATGGKPAEMQELLGAMWKNVSPIQGGNVTDTLGSTVLPGISTAMQLSQNKNWYQNSNIETERNDQGASALSKGIGDAIGSRPSRVEFAIKDTMGGVGASVLSASNLIAGTPPTKAGPSEIPVVGGVVGSVLRGDIGQRLQDAQDATLSPGDRKFLRDSGVKWEPATTGWAIGKVQLTQNEQELYQTTVNAQVGKMLAPLKTSDAWKRSDPELKDAYVRDQVEQIRASVRGYVEFVGGDKFSYRKYLAETGQVGAKNP